MRQTRERERSKNTAVGLLIITSLIIIVWAAAAHFNFAAFWQRPLAELRAGDVVLLVGLLLVTYRVCTWSPKREA